MTPGAGVGHGGRVLRLDPRGTCPGHRARCRGVKVIMVSCHRVFGT